MAKTLESNRRLEARYERALVGVMRPLHEEMVSTLLPRLASYVRTDAMSSPFGTVIDGIALKYATKVSHSVGPLFDRHAKDVAAQNAKGMRLLGIRPSDLRLGSVIATKRNDNLHLIEKAQRTYAQDVRDLFEQPDTFGLRVEEIKARLLERAEVSDSRAELIARDQTLKLNGAISQTRQENAGISRYTWSTSLDERVRPEHAALEGQVFDWSAPPIVGHPGQDFQCRCVSIPFIEGL